jgi:Tol biopolymer transport system component
VALTSLTGSEFYPTFSPDGEQVAFSWNGTKQDNWDIYVTLVGSPDVRRLTSDLGEDTRPTWSPDGRHIAFVRQRLDDSTIHLVSPLGGAERRLGDFRGADSLDWSPDSKWLAAGNSGQLNLGWLTIFPRLRPGGTGARGIYLVSVEGGGDARPLIVSTSNRVDSKPAFSPDGRRLAYASCASSDQGMVGMRDCDVAVIELDTSRATAQPPRRVTTQRFLNIYSLAWTRDGSAIIYAANAQSSLSSLWRVTIDGDHAPERIGDATDLAIGPALARSRDRLAFTNMSLDYDIYRFEAGGPVQLVAGSSFMDFDARLSLDGRRLAFASARAGGKLNIWIAEVDGANPQQLTRGPGVSQGSPSWSPDGRRIAFDAEGEDSRTHLWVIDADGGAPRRLTADVGDQVVPTWSHDGQWIYYSRWQADTRDIWRSPAAGGAPERLTRGAAGAFACESADGKSLLFQPKDADSPLMTMALPSGTARQLIACVKNSAFGVGPRGGYHVPCDPSPDPPVYLLDPKTGRNARLGTLDGLFPRPLGLSVSPDGNAIVYPRQVLSRADLMLIENFR